MRIEMMEAAAAEAERNDSPDQSRGGGWGWVIIFGILFVGGLGFIVYTVAPQTFSFLKPRSASADIEQAPAMSLELQKILNAQSSKPAATPAAKPGAIPSLKIDDEALAISADAAADMLARMGGQVAGWMGGHAPKKENSAQYTPENNRTRPQATGSQPGAIRSNPTAKPRPRPQQPSSKSTTPISNKERIVVKKQAPAEPQ